MFPWVHMAMTPRKLEGIKLVQEILLPIFSSLAHRTPTFTHGVLQAAPLHIETGTFKHSEHSKECSTVFLRMCPFGKGIYVDLNVF